MDPKTIENSLKGLKRTTSAHLPVYSSLLRGKFERSSLRVVSRFSTKLRSRETLSSMKRNKKSPSHGEQEGKKETGRHEHRRNYKSADEAERKRFVNENWKKIADFERENDVRDVAGKKRRSKIKMVEAKNCVTFKPEIILKNRIIEELTEQYKSQLTALGPKGRCEDVGPIVFRTGLTNTAFEHNPSLPLETCTSYASCNGLLNEAFVCSPKAGLEEAEQESSNDDVTITSQGVKNEGFAMTPPACQGIRNEGFQMTPPFIQGVSNAGFTMSPPIPQGINNEGFTMSPPVPKGISNEGFVCSPPLQGICNAAFQETPPDKIASHRTSHCTSILPTTNILYPSNSDLKPQLPVDNHVPCHFDSSPVVADMKWYDFMAKMRRKSSRTSNSDKENICKNNEIFRRKSEEFTRECLEEYRKSKRCSTADITLADYCKSVQLQCKVRVDLSDFEEVDENDSHESKTNNGGHVKEERGPSSEEGVLEVSLRKPKTFRRSGSTRVSTLYPLLYAKERSSLWKSTSTSKLPLELPYEDVIIQNSHDQLEGRKLAQKGMDFWVDGFKTNNKKKLEKINRINIHLQALFSSVEIGHVEKARTILESTDVDVNNLNADWLSPLDVSVLTNHKSLSKMLMAFGAQEGNHFETPEQLGEHLKRLSAEADNRVAELSAGLLTPDQGAAILHARSSFSAGGHHTASLTTCHGGAADNEKELLLWERRAKGLRKMLLGFDQARPPDAPLVVAVDVTSNHTVTVRLQGPELLDGAICTKFKVQWSEDDRFEVLAGEQELTDPKCQECRIEDLSRGTRYWFRAAGGNVKGYGLFKLATPASVVPSSWRDVQGREQRFAGKLRQLEELLTDIRQLRPENASEIKDFSDQEKSGETPALQRRNQKKKTTIKQLFTVTGKFHKNLKRGVFLVCLFYHDDRVLLTNEDFLPAIEVDETYPSSIYHDFHWLMKVACTWDDVKTLKQDMERNQTSTTGHFRIKLLQAAQQMQSALGIQDLGQLYFKPLRDSQGTLALCTVNHCPTPKSVSVLNLRWVPLNKIQKKCVTHEDSTVSEMLMASIQAQITYHQVSNLKLGRGLYLGYLKMRSSVELIQMIVPSKTPNVLPHCKVRDNPHVTCEEWEWLRRISSRHKSLENLQEQQSQPGRDLEFLKGSEQQQMFVEQVANTARRLFSYMDVGIDDAMRHRLYDLEVVELSPEISFLMIVPPAETSCSVPGQKDVLLQREDIMSIPVQVFEMVHLRTYQPDVISRYSRLSCILELDVTLAQHSHREAFSSTEVQVAKDRLSKLQDLQIQLNAVWKSVRWIMDVITFARDRTTSTNALHANHKSTSHINFAKLSGNVQTNSLSSGISSYGAGSVAGVSLRHLLALTKKKESKKSPSRVQKTKCLKENHQYVKCEKRSLLQLPDSPKDPKLLKANLSRGSWPGPGVDGMGALLDSSLSKSEQNLHLAVEFRGGRKMSGSDCSNSSHMVAVQSPSSSGGSSLMGPLDRDVMSNIGNRLPPSRSEDHLLLSQGLRCARQMREAPASRARASTMATTSVSATSSPLLPQRHLVPTDAASNTSGSLHSISSDESTAAVVSLPVTTPMRSASSQHSASLLSLAKPILPNTGSLNSVSGFLVPTSKSKIPATLSLNSLTEKRVTSPPMGGSLLSGNTIPVHISQAPRSLDPCMSASLPAVGISNLMSSVAPLTVPVTGKRLQSPIKTVSPTEAVLSTATLTELDLLQHPGLPLDSPGSSSLTSVSLSTLPSSSFAYSEYPSSIPSSYLTSAAETEVEDDGEDVSDGVKVPTPSSGVLQVYAAYETGLAPGTSLKLHVTPRTSAKEVVELVVKQLNTAVVLKGKDSPIYSAEKLKNFCLVAVIGARERCLRDDFKPLQLQNPWRKGRLYVRQKQDVLAALDHSSRQSAFL